MNMKLVERIERPRNEGGVDWDAPRNVLARRGTKELWWLRSRKCWKDQLSGYQPTGGELIIVDAVPSRRGYFAMDGRVTLTEGGRLSLQRVLEHEKAIDEFFGVAGVAKSIKLLKTLLVES
jgi:hypothetical protein